jgi:hypothetical protein
MWLWRSFVAFPFDLVVLQCAREERMTQAQLHAVTRGNVSLYTDSSFRPKRRVQANLSSSGDAHSPRQREVLNTAFSRARIHEERRALAGHLAGGAYNGRRLSGCEAARRRQARVTASARLGRYVDDRTRRRVRAQTRRHPACVRQCAVPPRGAGRGRKSAGTVLFTALRSCGVSPRSTGKRGNEKVKELRESSGDSNQ